MFEYRRMYVWRFIQAGAPNHPSHKTIFVWPMHPCASMMQNAENVKPKNGSRREFWWRQIDATGNGYPPMWEAVSHTWMDIRTIWGTQRKWMDDPAPDTSHIKRMHFLFFLYLSLTHIYIYIICCNWCGLLSQKDLGVAKGYGEETLFQSTPTTDFPAISHCCFLPLHFLDQSCCRTTMDAWGIRWFCCLYGHSAFQWPFLLQALQYEFKMRSCRLRFGRLGQGALPLPLPLAVRPRPVAVVSL